MEVAARIQEVATQMQSTATAPTCPRPRGRADPGICRAAATAAAAVPHRFHQCRRWRARREPAVTGATRPAANAAGRLQPGRLACALAVLAALVLMVAGARRARRPSQAAARAEAVRCSALQAWSATGGCPVPTSAAMAAGDAAGLSAAACRPAATPDLALRGSATVVYAVYRDVAAGIDLVAPVDPGGGSGSFEHDRLAAISAQLAAAAAAVPDARWPHHRQAGPGRRRVPACWPTWSPSRRPTAMATATLRRPASATPLTPGAALPRRPCRSPRLRRHRAG